VEFFFWLTIGCFVICLIFATAETASHLLSAIKVQRMLDGMRDRSRLGKRLLPKRAGALRATLAHGRLLCLAGAAMGVAYLFTQIDLLPAAAIGLAGLASILYLPMIIALADPNLVLRTLLPVARLFNIVLLPLTWPQRFLFARYKSRKLAREEDEDEEDEQDIEAYLEAAREEGLFKPDEEELVRQVAEFGDTVVREVMTPRVDMICVSKEATLDEFIRLAAEHKFSRLPVIDTIVDNVVGIAHVKALLAIPINEMEGRLVGEIISPPFFVPESKRVSSLLRDFQATKQHMAIVVDEYGGTAGLVTLEDILEELVGEIEDEHDEDEAEKEIVREADGSLVVVGSVDVDEVGELLGVDLDDERYETVSGLALNYLKRIPKAGETFETRGIRVEILEADEKTILKLRLRKAEEADEDE
jgi:putative hemolysin